MENEPTEPYVYQPYGSVTHLDHNEEGRLWGVGGVHMLAIIKGLTKEEANAVRAVLTPMV